MNRRALISTAGAGGVTVLLGLPKLAQASTQFVWKQSPIIKSAAAYMKPKFQAVRAAKQISVLTEDVWHQLGATHQNWTDEHGRLGNIHAADLWTQANQAVLFKKFPATTVNNILTDGWQYVLTGASGYIHDVPNVHPHNTSKGGGGGPCEIHDNCEDECKGREAMVIALDIGAFAFAWDPLVAGIFFFGSLCLAVANYIQCQ